MEAEESTFRQPLHGEQFDASLAVHSKQSYNLLPNFFWRIDCLNYNP
jgi:hypothetical protein